MHTRLLKNQAELIQTINQSFALSPSNDNNTTEVDILNWPHTYYVNLTSAVLPDIAVTLHNSSTTIDPVSFSQVVQAINSISSQGSMNYEDFSNLYFGNSSKNQQSYENSDGTFTLFGGLIGGLENIFTKVFSVVLNGLVDALSPLIKVFFDLLKIEIPIIVNVLIQVLKDLLPVVDVLVDALATLAETLVTVFTTLFEKLDKKFLLTEAVVVFSLTFYYSGKWEAGLYSTLIFFVIVGFTRASVYGQ